MTSQEEIANSIKERFGAKHFYPVEPRYYIKPGYSLEWTDAENRCGSGGYRIWRLLDESGNWVATGETCACGRGAVGLIPSCFVLGTLSLSSIRFACNIKDGEFMLMLIGLVIMFLSLIGLSLCAIYVGLKEKEPLVVFGGFALLGIIIFSIGWILRV